MSPPASPEDADVPVAFGVTLAASFLLGIANAISHGTYLGIALLLITCSLGILSWRFWIRTSRARDNKNIGVRSLTLATLIGLVALQVVALCDPKILAQPTHPWIAGRVIEGLSIALVLTYVPRLTGDDSERVRRARFFAFGLLVLVAGISLIHTSPSPIIDVLDVHVKGTHALLRGENPYVTVTVPGTGQDTGQPTPYVYPPSTLLFGLFGLLIGGDVRYAMLVAILITGPVLRSIVRRSGRKLPAILEDAPALLLWLTPLLPMILELSWTDPLQVMLITVGISAYVHQRRLLSAIVLGFAISSKQPMFWLIPLLGLGLRFRMKEWIAAGIAAALPVVPFVVLDFARLKYALFDFQRLLPPRTDALVVAVWMKQSFGLSFPTAIAFPLALGIIAIALWRLRGSISGISLAMALTYLVFFLFNKWAFANYYFLIGSLTTLAAACALHRDDNSDYFVPLTRG